jgi:hypothetical protein
MVGGGVVSKHVGILTGKTVVVRENHIISNSMYTVKYNTITDTIQHYNIIEFM